MNGNEVSATISDTSSLQSLMNTIDSTFGDGSGGSLFRVYIEDNKLLIKDNTTNNPTLSDINFTFSEAKIEQDMTKAAPVTFASNNALTIDKPIISFFDTLDTAIEAVEAMMYRADGDSQKARNIGIENSLLAVGHLFDHVVRKQTENGSNGQALQLTHEKAEVTLLNVNELKSMVLDTDIGAAVVELNQRTVSYQAMLSTIGKINQLNLVNFLR